MCNSMNRYCHWKLFATFPGSDRNSGISTILLQYDLVRWIINSLGFWIEFVDQINPFYPSSTVHYRSDIKTIEMSDWHRKCKQSPSNKIRSWYTEHNRFMWGKCLLKMFLQYTKIEYIDSILYTDIRWSVYQIKWNFCTWYKLKWAIYTITYVDMAQGRLVDQVVIC